MEEEEGIVFGFGHEGGLDLGGGKEGGRIRK